MYLHLLLSLMSLIVLIANVLFAQDVASVLYAERQGKGLYLLAKRRKRHAFVFRFAANSRPRRDMQRHSQHGVGQRVLCELELLLHRVQIARRKPVPGNHII